MLIILKKFEHGLVKVLIVLLGIVLVFATVELGWFIGRDLVSPPFLHVSINGLMDIIGLFMMILIGLELLESVKAYLEETAFHVEVILAVAMIAVARKVIILDVKKMDVWAVGGISAVILSLAVSYYLLARARKEAGGKA